MQQQFEPYFEPRVQKAVRISQDTTKTEESQSKNWTPLPPQGTQQIRDFMRILMQNKRIISNRTGRRNIVIS